MRSRVIWRRSATAIGVYVATVLGFLTTVVATRELGVQDYARFAAVIAASTFFQQLLDLTIEEALVKFGFRYVEAGRWGRLRRLFQVALGFKLVGGILAGLVIIILAPFSKDVWGTGGVVLPMAIASLISVAQSPENVAAGAPSAADTASSAPWWGWSSRRWRRRPQSAPPESSPTAGSRVSRPSRLRTTCPRSGPSWSPRPSPRRSTPPAGR